MPTFPRLLTAMVTPFDEKGQVDYAQARKLARALNKSGSGGVVVSGTTGESPTLTIPEKLRLFREVKEELGPGVVVVAGTGNYSTSESIELTREAEKTGVDACLLVVPYYNRPTQEGLYRHFKAIATSCNLPCIMYNVPSRTSCNLAAETVVRLSKVDNIIGLKDASANFRQIADIIQGVPPEFLVYSGNDGDTLHLMALGGYGVVGTITNLVGLQTQDMMDKLLAGKTQEAAAIHRHLLPLVDAMFLVANPIPLKFAMNHLGFRVGPTRLPLCEPDDKTAASIVATLKKVKIDLPIS